MRKIYTIGETVFDIIFKNDIPQTSKPGGSMLNTAVSLGRLNLPVHLISEYANDVVGNLIDRFLQENSVSTRYIHHYENGKTPLALAFLNEQNNATYTFYKIYPENRLDIGFPVAGPEDIILFGSIYAITPEIRTKLISFITESAKNNAFIIYDPNIRKTTTGIHPNIINYVQDNINYASIVRASNEDCEALFAVNEGKSAYQKINEAGCKFLIYTTGGKEVQLFTEQFTHSFCLPQIKTVSTIGAGDTFNAGIIYSFIQMGIDNNNINNLTVDGWNNVLNTAVSFATNVCLSYDNYISLDFAKKIHCKIS